MSKIQNLIFGLTAAQLIAITFLLAIVFGACLLEIPSATYQDISFIDALFTSTSAVCVTGLTVIDTGSSYTHFGQVVILVLIQIGGLGITTYGALFASVLSGRLTLKQTSVIRDTFAHLGKINFRTLLIDLIVFTLAIELIGALVLFYFIPHDGFFFALFHAISAFCNAGFSLYNDSFVSYRSSTGVNLMLCMLIIAGGIGFFTVHDIRLKLTGKISRLSLHSRVIIMMTVILLLGGSILILILEWSSALNGMSLHEKILTSFFQATTARTAGFNTINLGLFSSSTIFILIILMFIGASPGSCAGGVKTSTIAVLLSFFKSRIQGREDVFLFKRTIPSDNVTKAISVATASSLVIVFMFFIFLSVEGWDNSYTSSPHTFTDALFEVVSAYGTVGLSLGATPKLSVFGKIFIIVTMFIGRVGPLVLALAVGGEKQLKYKYAEERVMVG